MPYEWELPRMRNERLHNKNAERVISEHDRVYQKCLMKSESAAICIDRATDEISKVKEMPRPYMLQMSQLERTCKERVTLRVIRRADYYKTSNVHNNFL